MDDQQGGRLPDEMQQQALSCCYTLWSQDLGLRFAAQELVNTLPAEALLQRHWCPGLCGHGTGVFL